MERGKNYRQLINSTRWRRLRLAVLGARPYCEDCARQGRVTEATEVHHITPVGSVPGRRTQEELCYDTRNLMSLCHHCHMDRHSLMKKNSREEQQRRGSAAAADLSARLWGEIPGGVIFRRGPPSV